MLSLLFHIALSRKCCHWLFEILKALKTEQNKTHLCYVCRSINWSVEVLINLVKAMKTQQWNSLGDLEKHTLDETKMGFTLKSTRKLWGSKKLCYDIFTRSMRNPSAGKSMLNICRSIQQCKLRMQIAKRHMLGLPCCCRMWKHAMNVSSWTCVDIVWGMK